MKVPPLPSLRQLTSMQPCQSSPTYGSRDPWGASTRPVARILPPTSAPLPLLARIGTAEDKLKYSGYLHEMLQEQERVVGAGVTADAEGRLENGKRDVLTDLGYPVRDDDIDYCLEDTPGLSRENFGMLKESLQTHLGKIRQACGEACGEAEKMLGKQAFFRVVSQSEVDRRLGYIVGRFIRARKMVLLKYRGYVRNRRWIENVATRQRRGCLTHRQNNVLRLWLFSNFGNPYPEGNEKRRLIQKTGLSMTQINNWLINARSRVWKPTVELMSGERVRKEMTSREDREMDFNRNPNAPHEDLWPASQTWSLDFD